MQLTKKPFGAHGVEIVCQIGSNKWSSVWSAPSESIDHAGSDYLENRYKCLTTEKRVKRFKALYKELMKDEAMLIPKVGKNLFDGAKIDKGPILAPPSYLSLSMLFHEVFDRFKGQTISDSIRAQIRDEFKKTTSDKVGLEIDVVFNIYAGEANIMDFVIEEKNTGGISCAKPAEK